MTVKEAKAHLRAAQETVACAQDALIDAIREADANGVTRTRIAKDAGMSRTTLYAILKEGSR